jgi:hypothetical protein
VNNDIENDQEQINEFLIPLILYGIHKLTSSISKYSVLFASVLIGVGLYLFTKLSKYIYNQIKQARFESKVEKILLFHLEQMEDFTSVCKELGIEKSGFVTLSNINSNAISCIKNKNHDEALVCVVNIFKESHFYLMDLFLQTLYFNDIKLNKVLKTSKIRNYDTGDKNLNFFVNNYYDLVKNFFYLIIDLQKIRKSLVLSPYDIEQEFDTKFVELVKYYENIIDLKSTTGDKDNAI